MGPALDLSTIELFIGFVVPGLVSMSVYRLIMPSRGLVWSDALVQGLFYSSLNFVVLAPGIAAISSATFRSAHPIGAWLLMLGVIILLPALWPVALRMLLKAPAISARVQLPYPTAWDNDGDIYVEAVYHVDAAGQFGEPMPNTKGVLLRKDEYSYLELFNPPAE